MTEIYRNFEGKLDVDNREGHIIYQCEGFKEIHFLTVSQYVADSKVRISDSVPFDFDDLARIDEISVDIENGCYCNSDKCQVFYNGKWYSGKRIAEIQTANHSPHWKCSV